MNQTELLSDYVLRVSAENGCSLTEIERIAKRKGFLMRYVWLTSEIMAEPRRHLMTNHLQPGMPLIGIRDNFRRSYRTACRLAGVQGVTPYAWRHLFGTDLHRGKIPPAIAMMIMGHTEDKTHRRYVNDYQRLAAQAAAELEEYRKKKTG